MYLGIDLGSSELKTVLISADQQLIAQATIPLVIHRPHALWAEQSPQDWWVALLQAMGKLAANHAEQVAQIKAIGLTGQMHGAVLLDANGEILRPAILWNDTRSNEECRELELAVPFLAKITGNQAMPGFTAPKLLWVAKHESEIFKTIHTVLLPKDYLRYCLSGDAISDMSDAAGTLWLDVGLRDWSDVVLNACSLSRKHMPRLVEGSAIAGYLKPELAKLWGITPPISPHYDCRRRRG